MKKIILTVLTLTFPITFCFSQDVIKKKTAEDVHAKVLEVTTTEIKFKRFDNLDGPTYTVLKDDVLMIIYENGTKDVFNESSSMDKTVKLAEEKRELFMQGELDATIYYTKYKPAATGTLVTSLISPLVGLVPAVACSSTKPTDWNLTYPSPGMMKDADYHKGYTQKAKKIKQGKVWKNWAIGLGANVVAALIIAAGQ